MWRRRWVLAHWEQVPENRTTHTCQKCISHSIVVHSLPSPLLLQTGKCLLEKQIHEKHIMDLQMSTDLTHIVTASNDRTAKLVDTQARRSPPFRAACVAGEGSNSVA